MIVGKSLGYSLIERGRCRNSGRLLRSPISWRSAAPQVCSRPSYVPVGRVCVDDHRARAARMRARWCQLCLSAWSSMTNCAVTGAPSSAKWRRPVQLYIGEPAYRGGRLTAIPAQEFERGGFGYPGMFLGVFGVQLGDNFPRDSVTALPLAIARARSISIGYIVATWCTMTPTERRSRPDTGVRHSASESPSAKAAKPAAPSSMRSASDSARRLTARLFV